MGRPGDEQAVFFARTKIFHRPDLAQSVSAKSGDGFLDRCSAPLLAPAVDRVTPDASSDYAVRSNRAKLASGKMLRGLRMAKEIRLNAFAMNCVGHQSPGLWRHPRDRSSDYNRLPYWIDLAKTLERGRFDGLFLADVLGVYDVYGRS